MYVMHECAWLMCVYTLTCVGVFICMDSDELIERKENNIMMV